MTAAAAAIAGDMRCVRAPLPWRPSKLRFEVDPFRKEMLLAGRDEIGLTLGFETQIREFEARHAREMAWVVPPRAGG